MTQEITTKAFHQYLINLGLFRWCIRQEHDGGFTAILSMNDNPRIKDFTVVKRQDDGTWWVRLSKKDIFSEDITGSFFTNYEPKEHHERLEDRKKYEVDFLGFKITNTWNSDGYVLQGVYETTGDLWKTHLGNFKKPEDAKRKALMVYMAERIKVFHAQVINRALYGSGTHMEWFTLEKHFEKEGIVIPAEITHSHDQNFSIMVCGEKL